MIGAILGSIIGSPYENTEKKVGMDFPLFGPLSHWTADTVMTLAVAEALMRSKDWTDSRIWREVTESMQKWGRRYPNAGYGHSFARWLRDENPMPYGSCGNGSAMRVSAAGWLFDTLEETRHIARLTAEVTHNHPEGIKGAEAVASVVFLARRLWLKEDIRRYITTEFGYDLSRSCDEIRQGDRRTAVCQTTVPEAITAFLEGAGFEDTVRKAVSLGGDTDTLACIAGAAAGAMHGVPEALEAKCKTYLQDDMLTVLERFEVRKTDAVHWTPAVVDHVGDAIEWFSAAPDDQREKEVLAAISRAVKEENVWVVPALIQDHYLSMTDIKHVWVSEHSVEFDSIRAEYLQMRTDDGRNWLMAYTGWHEYDKGEKASYVSKSAGSILTSCLDMYLDGVILNPRGDAFRLTRDKIPEVLEAARPKDEILLRVGDITRMKVDAIVNAANHSLLGGGGVDGAIHRAAGPKLLEECIKLHGCRTGEAKITKGWDLPAKYVIHTVGPVYQPGNRECEEQLFKCYWNSLDQAMKKDLHTIAFPAISTGAYGYPPEEAARVALSAIWAWHISREDYGMEVTLVFLDEELKEYYQKLLDEERHASR